jgi:hypothetical protein
MISEKETAEMLGEYFPELLPELKKQGVMNSIHKTLSCFVDYTKKCAYSGNTEELKRCFALANDFITKGNSLVVSAMDSVFVFSLSLLLDGLTSLQLKVKGMLSEGLTRMYYRQIMTNYP